MTTKNIPVSEEEHSRVWLAKFRLKTKDLNGVIGKAIDALAEKEGWEDLQNKKEDEVQG